MDAPRPPPPTSPRRWLRQHTSLLAAIAWLGAGVAAVGLTLSLLWPTDLHATGQGALLVALAAFMAETFHFHIALALVAAGVFGTLTRRPRLAIVGAALSLFGLVPAAISMLPRERPQLTSATPRLTVMSANLLYSRVDPAVLRARIDSVRPDVVVLQEYTTDAAQGYRDVLVDFPYRAEHPQDDAFGQAIFSKVPFASAVRTYPPEGSWDVSQMYAVIEFDGRRVGVLNMHVLPPVSLDYFARQREQTAALASLARKAVATGEVDGLILAGDLNAAPNSGHLRAMAEAGLEQAHAAVGRGRGSTWPRTGSLRYLPGIRLDHVLVGGALQSVDCGVGDDTGSDHRPVWGIVAWRGR